MNHRVDSILARLKMEGQTSIGSVEELVQWAFQSKEHLDRVAARDTQWIYDKTGIPIKVLHLILYSRQFIQAIFDELHFRYLNPSTLGEVYDKIIEQLKDPEVSLGAKRSMLEFMIRQMGLEKPRKLSVKQQSEVVVRVEPTRPVEILEVLGVPAEPIPALSEANPAQVFGDVAGGEPIVELEAQPVAEDER